MLFLKFQQLTDVVFLRTQHHMKDPKYKQFVEPFRHGNQTLGGDQEDYCISRMIVIMIIIMGCLIRLYTYIRIVSNVHLCCNGMVISACLCSGMKRDVCCVCVTGKDTVTACQSTVCDIVFITKNHTNTTRVTSAPNSIIGFSVFEPKL